MRTFQVDLFSLLLIGLYIIWVVADYRAHKDFISFRQGAKWDTHILDTSNRMDVYQERDLQIRNMQAVTPIQ